MCIRDRLKLAFMKRIWLYLLFSLSLLPAVKAQTVVSIHIDATINPSTAEFIHRAIAKAENKKAECLIIHLNTPGGLLKSTRNIVGDIMESSVPVLSLIHISEPTRLLSISYAVF